MTRKYPTFFTERNRIVIAVIGLALMIAAFFVTFYADSMPIIGGGEEHQAYFAEAGGLREGDEVRVAGVKVGNVTGIQLDGARVLVTFQAEGVTLGPATSAAVKVKTLLGQKYLAIEPHGIGELAGPIPVSNTTTPYDVNAALSDLSSTVDEIDMDRLEESLTAVAHAFRNTPESVRGMVDGLTRLSRTVASRDEELARLLSATDEVTGTLAGRTEEIGKLIEDGDALLRELAARRDAVKHMLESTAELGRQVRGLVADNRERLRPALRKLDEVAAILQRNQEHLDDALEKLGPYYRLVTATMGNGPWIDAYICGLLGPDNAPVLQNDIVRNCHPDPHTGGGR